MGNCRAKPGVQIDIATRLFSVKKKMNLARGTDPIDELGRPQPRVVVFGHFSERICGDAIGSRIASRANTIAVSRSE
jgi:hypothetical protein